METIAGYHLKTTLGSGGMASVYLATQESLDRQVAIKVLDASLIDDPLIQAQFVQESKLIASLNHPNIVQVIDQGVSAQGHPYFVMPFVKSITLNAVLKRNDINATRKIDIAFKFAKPSPMLIAMGLFIATLSRVISWWIMTATFAWWILVLQVILPVMKNPI